MFIDKHYYFELGAEGDLSNWSGCGNDLRARSAMVRRLIIDSCRHLITTYGVDGFRFDLAELLGRGVLVEIERALKRVKSDVILIAEPWSFRGHIAGELASTGWASWNDGFRDFARDFVRGRASREAFEYFLQGSPGHFARWPAQTINYTESHDDLTWIDAITENDGGNGHDPTSDDRRRTHLMAALLFGAIGVPMLSAGQDFLRSKHGVSNTYQRGDLNALDYRRLIRYGGTHAYFAGWIAFRLSEPGRLLRHYSRAPAGFFQFFHAPDSPAVAVVYNAEGSPGEGRLLLALNPGTADVVIPLPAPWINLAWRMWADHEHFVSPDRPRAPRLWPAAGLFLPALGCSLWSTTD
jgi:pullulanase/glycogen debranching enzyme